LAVLAGMVVFVTLGLWQAGKGNRLEAELSQRQQRQHLGPVQIGAALVEPEALRDAPIRVMGRYEPQGQFFLDNRQLNGQPGLNVMTPLRIDGGQTRILVNRGWIGWPHGRGELPQADVPPDSVVVTGLAFVPSSNKFFLMPQPAQADSKLRLRLDLAALSQQAGYPLQPVVLLQNPGDAPDALVRRWDPPQDRVAQHRGYAFQWFGMALALLVFYLMAVFRRRRTA